MMMMMTHALMSTQGVFLARSISRSKTLMYACGSDRKPEKTARKRHLANDAQTTSARRRTTAEATPSERNYSATNEARRRRREYNYVRRTGNYS